ncbi:hypothetical protein ACA910_014552 [Epithemia clementina (nom. ined.)]
MDQTHSTFLLVAYRGTKVEILLVPGTRVQNVKDAVVAAATTSVTNDARSSDSGLLPKDIKLMFKGKVLSDDNEDLYEYLKEPETTSPTKKEQSSKKVHRLIATGLSQVEAAKTNEDFQKKEQQMAREVRDDLSEAGVRQQEQRKRMGQHLLQKAAGKSDKGSHNAYGFGKIETLSDLPDSQKAREILETLANDPGILACMAKHQWHVGTLMELYPEGQVGESAVCVMGLNENKGQRIKLRIRTDDLKGFRKMLTIRKVLFHELAHNVHSEHNQDFFVLMRQIEKECNELDWTQGAGLSRTTESLLPYQGGTYRLGGGEGDTSKDGTNHKNSTSQHHRRGQQHQQQRHLSHRELALRAALQRMTAEEQEIEQNCGCGRADVFLPEAQRPSSSTADQKESRSKDNMDISP